jgi:hypothetical protein
MATVKYFNGKVRKLPGVYSEIQSGVNNAPTTYNYSKVLIIDTGLGATYVGGSGVNGALKQDLDSVYVCNDILDAKAIIRGGLLYKAVEALFQPDKGAIGISSLNIVKAATTTQATMTFTGTGGGAAGGSFVFRTIDEGIAANGILESTADSQTYGEGAIGIGELDGDKLVKGYGWSIDTGTVDVAKWIFKVWRGSWTGVHTDSIAYNEVAIQDAAPVLVAQSPEFNNIQELINWADDDFDFNSFFVKGTCTVTGTGVITQPDVTAVAGYNVATGATETYGAGDLTSALAAVQGLDYTHILCDKYGITDYNGASVGAILSHIQTDAKYDKYLVYGGGKDKTEFSTATGSIAQAAYFNTNKAIVVHGDPLKSSNLAPTGFRRWPSIIKAAYVLGRCVGLQPQVPVTNKSIGIEGEAHKLSDKQKEQALDAGVLATYFDADFNAFVVLQGVNTIQNNRNVILANGTSFSWQAERIKAQLNKDIVINAKVQLLGDPNGVNRNTLSAERLKNWTETFLETKKATASQDNLIISYQDVTVIKDQDNYNVRYGFVMNGEVSKIFMTGIIIDF